MSTPDPTAIVKAPLGWAKARPFVFFLFLLIVVVATIRFREAIAAALAKIPVVGKWLTGIAAGTAAILFVSLGSPQVPFITHPSMPLVESCQAAHFVHGHRAMYAELAGDGFGGAVLVMPGGRQGSEVRS